MDSEKGTTSKANGSLFFKQWVIALLVLITFLTFIAAIIFTGFFSRDRIIYLRMIKDVDCMQYSSTNLTVIIPDNVKLNIKTGVEGSITYNYELKNDVGSEMFKCDWNPCYTATFYTIDNKKMECTYLINNVIYYYITDAPVYNDVFEDYYKPRIIAISVLWILSIPFIILLCIACVVSKK